MFICYNRAKMAVCKDNFFFVVLQVAVAIDIF